MEDQSNTTSNRHTWHPNGPTHRRHPSYVNDVSNGGILSSKPAVKRLFSNRSPSRDRDLERRGVETSQDAENEYDDDLEYGASNSAAKRRRSGEWPLPNASHVAPPRAPLRSRVNSPNYPRRTSSVQPRHAMAHQRTSSFVEGSMNDRVSVPPPAIYTDYEDYMDRYQSIQQARTFERTDSGNYIPRTDGPDLSSAAANDANQKTFRFGKNMFSVFNPSNWKLFSRTPKGSKPARDHENIEIAQQAYQLHKASGAFNAHATQSSRFPRPQSMARESANFSARSPQRVSLTMEQYSQQRDSGIDEAPDAVTPQHEKRYGRVYESSTSLVDDPRAASPSSASQASHVSNDGSPRKRRSSFSLKKPNFGLHSASTSDLPLTSSQNSKKMMPPKKQIAHEQKLVKKISNLEIRLEELKRELKTSINEPPPSMTMEQLNKTLNERPPVDFTAVPPRNSRRPFGGPTLATLPSERAISDYAGPPEDDEHDEEAVFREKIGVAFGESEADSYLRPASQNFRQSSSTSRKVQAAEPDFTEAGPSEGLLTSQAAAIIPSIEDDALQRIVSDASSAYESVATDNTVIHHDIFERIDHLQHGLSEQEDVEVTPKAEPVSRKVSAKRKSMGDEDDEDYESSKSSESDDDVENEDVEDTPKAEPISRKVSAKRKAMGDADDEDYKPSKSSESDNDVEDSTPRKSISRQNSKKQKTSAVDSPRNTIGKKKSFDSPKGSFISSTKYPKRASAIPTTPPKASFADSPKGTFVNSTKFSKRTSVTPPKDTKRKSNNQFPAPPSSSFNFVSGKQAARPSTPGVAAAGKKPLQSTHKRPASPSLATASGAKKSSIPIGQAMSSYSKAANGPEEENAIPPVPKLSKETLKKHLDNDRMKSKKLTIEDIQRQQKTPSIASSSHPDQDIARQSIEKEGAAARPKETLGTKKVEAKTKGHDEAKKKQHDEEFMWDDDVF